MNPWGFMGKATGPERACCMDAGESKDSGAAGMHGNRRIS